MMRIGPINATHVWKLAEVTTPLPSYAFDDPEEAEAFFAHEDAIRIEQHENGHPILIVTDGAMLTVLVDDGARCEGLERPMTLRLLGSLHKALSRAGAERRKRMDVTIEQGDEPQSLTISIGRAFSSSAKIIPAPESNWLVRFGEDYPPWRKILPSPERIEESWNDIQSGAIEAVGTVNLELLRKMPRFGFGGVVIQTVLREDWTPNGKQNTLCHLVRETDISHRTITMMAGMGHEGLLFEQLPKLAPAYEYEEAGEADDAE